MPAAENRYRVIEAWQLSYPDPIVLVRGEQVKLSGREDIWEGHR